MNGKTIGRPMEILLVEDSLVDARLTIGALQQGKFNHRLTLVRDGEEAGEFLGREGKFSRAPRPDLILLDLFLPKKDGLTLLFEIREDELLRDIPVVVLTSSDDEEDRMRSENLGVGGFLRKPVHVASFVQLVQELKNCWHADLILPSAQ